MRTDGKEGRLLRGSWQFGNGLHFDGFDGAPVLIQLKSNPLADRHVFKKFRFDDLKENRLARCRLDKPLMGREVQPFQHSGYREALDLVG